MEFSRDLLKRRIIALLPASSVESLEDQNGRRRNDPDQPPIVDVSDLPLVDDDEKFLQEAYRRILGRDCDVSGFVSCLELLKRHVPRRVILLQLINSEEGKRRKIRFTGVQQVGPSIRPPASRFSLRTLTGRLGAVVRDVIRRILFTRFDSIDHKLEFLLREVASRTDGMTAKVDESFVKLSTKLDAYVANLSEENRGNREALALQSSQTLELHRSVDRARELLASVESNITQVRQDLTQVRQDLADQTLRLDQAIPSLQKDLPALAVRLDEARAALSTLVMAAAEEARQGTLAINDTIRAHMSEVLEQQSGGLDLVRSLAVNSGAMLASLAEVSAKIRPPVITAGANVLATEVAGMIVGVPGNEWRMAAYHAFRGLMEPGLTKYFCSLIKPGTVVVDVGANVGIYTLLAAKLLQGNGKIHSFEPTPRTYVLLKENVQVNGFLELGIINLHQLAVTDKTGQARLSIFNCDCGHNTLFSDGNADCEIDVSTTSLDDILANEKQVDIVKIDAEGAEPLIVRGMKQVIKRNPKIRIVLEFAPTHLRRAGSSPLELLDEIASLGFDLRRIDDVSGGLVNVTREELTKAFSLNLQLELPSRTRENL